MDWVSYKKSLYLQFKKKHSKELKELSEKAIEHKILFCANWWTGNGTDVPMFMSFDFDKVFDVAFMRGITNSYPNLTRIEYWEVERLYPEPQHIGYVGFEDNH